MPIEGNIGVEFVKLFHIGVEFTGNFYSAKGIDKLFDALYNK